MADESAYHSQYHRTRNGPGNIADTTTTVVAVAAPGVGKRIVVDAIFIGFMSTSSGAVIGVEFRETGVAGTLVGPYMRVGGSGIYATQQQQLITSWEMAENVALAFNYISSGTNGQTNTFDVFIKYHIRG